jgi:2-hydroxychromene-2-carboxylate isomerase
VPTYVIGGQIFFGREHLPRVRWLLGGGAGAAPDIAYEHQVTQNATASPGARGSLAVAIDFKSPSAYLAIEPTCALAQELGIAIEWQPFLVSPRKDHSLDSGTDSRGARHRRLRADYGERDVMRYAAGRGLEMRGLHRQTDSSLAAIGLLWMRRGPAALIPTYVKRVFESYWREELNLEDEHALHGLLAEIGAPITGFSAFVQGEGRAELERLQSELTRAGLFEVPTYLLDGDMYVGRQHLPLLHALLSSTDRQPSDRNR